MLSDKTSQSMTRVFRIFILLVHSVLSRPGNFGYNPGYYLQFPEPLPYNHINFNTPVPVLPQQFPQSWVQPNGVNQNQTYYRNLQNPGPTPSVKIPRVKSNRSGVRKQQADVVNNQLPQVLHNGTLVYYAPGPWGGMKSIAVNRQVDNSIMPIPPAWSTIPLIPQLPEFDYLNRQQQLQLQQEQQRQEQQRQLQDQKRQRQQQKKDRQRYMQLEQQIQQNQQLLLQQQRQLQQQQQKQQPDPSAVPVVSNDQWNQQNLGWGGWDPNFNNPSTSIPTQDPSVTIQAPMELSFPEMKDQYMDTEDDDDVIKTTKSTPTQTTKSSVPSNVTPTVPTTAAAVPSQITPPSSSNATPPASSIAFPTPTALSNLRTTATRPASSTTDTLKRFRQLVSRIREVTRQELNS